MARSFSFKKGFNSQLIVSKIADARNIGTDGRISASSIEISDWESIAMSALERPDGVSDRTINQAIRLAIFSRTLPKKFSQKQFEDECRKSFNIINSRTPSKYRAIFCISLNPDRPINWMSTSSGRMYFAPDANSSFMRKARAERADLVSKYRYVDHDAGKQLMTVLVHVSSVSAHEAHSKALDSLDEVRGLINFVLNEPRISQTTMGPPSPINRVRIGSIQTLHTEDGSRAQDNFWYDRRPVLAHSEASLTFSGGKMLARFNAIRKRLQVNHGLSAAAWTALRAYARALDSDDWRAAFVELWVILERLTCIEGADYDRLVSRAAYMHEDHQSAKELAQHLRVRRNNIIHSAADDEDAELLIFQTKQLIEPLMYMYISNPYKFKNASELGEFLDLPKATSQLLHRGKLIAFALQFRRPHP